LRHTSRESEINELSIDVWFVSIGQYLTIWNLRMQNIETLKHFVLYRKFT